MIVERAEIEVTPGEEAGFEEAIRKARGVVERAAGFRSISVARGIESPSRYLLIVEWETLEDHTEGFRGGELFAEWRALIGPFFAQPPEVQHFEPLDRAG